MRLSKKVKTALDESRILILGAQILLGFGFRSVFQNAYDELPTLTRLLNGAALVLILLAVTLLIVPDTYHRIVLQGRDSRYFYDLITEMAEIALLPFALALGLDVFVAGERLFGIAGGALAGLSFTGLALGFWYGLGYLRRSFTGRREAEMASQRPEPEEETPLDERINQMLTEARVVLPGAQAVFGFQLAIILTQSFEKLPAAAKTLHAVSLGCIGLTIILLMAPAAYHRIVFSGEDTEELHRVGSWFIGAATVPLALGLAGDLALALGKSLNSALGGAIGGIAALALLVGLWHIFPIVSRWQRSRSDPS